MRQALLIADNDLRHLVRSRVALTGLVLTALLALVSALISTAYEAEKAGLRDRLQVTANAEFANQPNRHPHRMVHFGHFAVRPSGGLSAFDPGVEAYTGDLIFLEGHRQNSANFADARQSSLLVRFGQLSPALVLQVITPLLLIFIGATTIAHERERGTLRQALLAGATGRDIVLGKALTLGAAALAIATPGLVLLAWQALSGQARPSAVGSNTLGHLLYLSTWCLLIVAVSAFASRSRTALTVLVGAWVVSAILVPRISPEVGRASHPLPTRIETDIAIARDLRALGDSHNPDDPYFAAFKQKTLRQYGVARVEELPLNYRGLLAVEGEKLTSGLFNRYADDAFTTMSAQSRLMDGLAILSPTIAIRRLSMVTAETDLAAYARFLRQAEAYRYELVQRLNWLQARAVTAKDDAAKSSDSGAEARSRISADHWRTMPVFRPTRPSADEVLGAAAPALVILFAWLAAAAGLAGAAAVHLNRDAK